MPDEQERDVTPGQQAERHFSVWDNRGIRQPATDFSAILKRVPLADIATTAYGDTLLSRPPARPRKHTWKIFGKKQNPA
jgi:hypothetical protein